MSRFVFDDDRGQRWSVGWDQSMRTYFAQVESRGVESIDDDLRGVVGDRPGEAPTVDDLVRFLRPELELPMAVVERLRLDTGAQSAPVFLPGPHAAGPRHDGVDDELWELHEVRSAAFPASAGSGVQGSENRAVSVTGEVTSEGHRAVSRNGERAGGGVER